MMGNASEFAGSTVGVIRYSVCKSSIGLVSVAESARGLCAVLIGDDTEQLRLELRDCFPGAELIEGAAEAPAAAGPETLAASVLSFLESPDRGLDVRLDVRGTEFQRSVWKALCEIPPGETASYTEIARRLGRPKSARAVARACAANALAIIIPCHRVVRSDGALSGYRWGVERKRLLLDREAFLPAVPA